MKGNLRVGLTCCVPKPATTKRMNPLGDVDNYAKGVLDVLTKKGYWEDDMQIVELHVEKVWPEEGQSTGIYITIKELPYD